VKKLVIVAALVLALAGSARAQQAIAEGKWWKRPRIAQALALTPAQTAELEKIFAKSRPKLIDLKADLEKKQFAYQQAMSADKVDRKEVEATIAAREAARAKLQTELSLMELDMKQVLTPEQREKAQELREELRERLQERRRQWRQGAAADEEGAAPPPRATAPRRGSPPPSNP
jgi:Spy/CpxP family protein refolding chaperone